MRLGNWPRGRELSEKHLAIAFYKDGKLLKSYSTKDLVKDPKALFVTTGHYKWQKGKLQFDDGMATYINKDGKQETDFVSRVIIVTKDNIAYMFNLNDGEILMQQKVEE